MRDMSCSSPPISRLAAANGVPMLKSPASSISTGPWLARAFFLVAITVAMRAYPPVVLSSLSVNGV